MSAEASHAQKENWLKAKLAPWKERFAPLGAAVEEGRWNYRDKICLSTDWYDGSWKFGLIARQQLIAIPRCPVHSPRVREALRVFSEVLPARETFPMVFYVQAGRQVTLVLKTVLLPGLGWLNHDLQHHLARIGVEGLWLHLNPSTGRRLFAKNGWHLIWGQSLSLNGDGLVYGPSAFQQLIPELYARSLDEAEAFLAPGQDDAVIDLYCGVGASLVRWLRRGAQAVGVELSGEAVECARQNAPQAQVLRGQCAHRISQLQDWLDERSRLGVRRLLYLNPPRAGLEPEVLDWMVDSFRPERLAYLSCSAGTLRRDLDALSRCGYQLERITPYDFFPQTYHVEALVLLRKP
jgi:23S rRNA (uracil1939-C5)-methyltransferase